ncbi:MAG: hypothetical protein PGN29_16015 [Gordonia paraffinivorans]
MSTVGAIVVGVFVAVGLAEMAMTGIAAMLGLSSWRRRFAELTRVDPPAALRLTVGALAGVSAVAMGVGYARPVWWVIGGTLLLAVTAPILVRQIAIGTRGSALTAYTLFTVCGVVALTAGASAV